MSAAATPLAPELDSARCYRALTSRDARFDGRFFVGVRTTGVYCRPVCPARTPLLRNIRFYRCAAAAAEDGFRPCLRCRPETSPGTPAWSGTSATVSRALRHIEAGALDHGSVADLAERLGVGERHLRRLFNEHLGATPVAVAQTRRLHFAKKLLDETDLPMTRIALDSGYSSLRRFNTAFRDTYGVSPRELRRRHPSRRLREGGLSLKLPLREPFDWELLLEFLAMRAIPGVEQVRDGRYVRTVRYDDLRGEIALARIDGEPAVRLEIPHALSPALVAMVNGARRLLDLSADPVEIDRQLSLDATLRPRIRRRPGLRVPGAWDPFETAVRAVVGQQISVRGATTILGRIVDRCGERLDGTPGEAPTAEDNAPRLFPTAQSLASADLDGIGMPGARIRTVRSLAEAVASGDLVFGHHADLDDVVTRLIALRGIGPWTAHYIAMRALGEPDAFPTGDVGVMRALGTEGERVSAPEADARSQSWRPWRAYAVMYLWTKDAPSVRRPTRKK
ncbi:MAG: DNA-3-methyladenine glycosylase 2 family protein [Myxococcales bacterium]|nr:MAG: DNA-3-methyladenine glycosylase 2 family protein [Myxococcales bacterium]